MIYTFYSYKGGVGRSMALVNIAELMYRAGLKVLMVDWDLEAPGLERFFPDSMKQVLNTPGVIEMLLAYKEKALQFSPESGKSLFPVDQIESYIVDIDIDTTSSAKLSLLPAGYRAEGQFAEYVNRIKTFDWQDFYQNWEGEIYFEWLREQLENLADVVLIDSRTGVTEMGGVCTYQLADVVVLLCAANEQNIDGTLQMVKSFSDPRLPELRNGRKLKTLVVPARIEKYELTILNKFRQKFFECFAPYMPSELQPDEPQSKRDFFLQFEIPYIPLYAFEEIIAVSQTGDKRSIEMEQAYDELCQALYHLAPNDSVIKQRLLGSTSTEFVGGEPMTRRYNLKKIRILLTEGFTNEELRRLCHDVRDFRVVYDQLAEYSGKAEIIDRLLEHTEQKRLIEILLTRAKEHNPIRYEKHQPYHESTIASPTFQEVWKIQTLRKPKHLFAGPDYLCLVTKEALHFLSPNDGASVLSPLIRVKDLLLADNAPVGGVVTPSGNLLLTLLPPNLSGKASLWSLKLIGPSTGQPKEVLCQRIYEAPSAQLSAPVIDNETVYLIQRGPELVILDPVHGQEQRTLPLPKLDNLHRDCVSFVFAADRLCLGLCNGAILALDPQTGQTLMPLREPDGSMLSPLATDGVYLFFGFSANQRGSSPSRVCALDVVSGQEIWNFEMPPDLVGRYRSVQGQPLVINDVLYVTGRNHFLHALDPGVGQELWRYQMPAGIELGPVWAGRTMVVADRQRNVHALPINEPTCVVTCHYDLKVPPVLNEWNPLIFTLINTGNDSARNVVLRLSGDFVGRSEHHTQQLYIIPSGGFKRCFVQLKPTSAGATVHLVVRVDYQYHHGLTCTENLDLFIPVRRSNIDLLTEKEAGISPDGQWQYNYTALRALLMAALTNSGLTQICLKYFQPVYDELRTGMGKTEKIKKLIDYADEHQQVEELLTVMQQYNPTQYEQYIQEVKHILEATIQAN